MKDNEGVPTFQNSSQEGLCSMPEIPTIILLSITFFFFKDVNLPCRSLAYWSSVGGKWS